jgi:hypothetical protein
MSLMNEQVDLTAADTVEWARATADRVRQDEINLEIDPLFVFEGAGEVDDESEGDSCTSQPH